MGKYYRLGDLAEIGRGSSPRPITDQRYFVNGDIPWIKIADATASGKYIYKTREYVNEYGASYSRKLKRNSLIIAASGTLGFPKFLGTEGCIHDGWMYFSNIKEDILNRDYLYYCLITLNGYFNNLSYGAAIQNINTPIVKNTKVFLPDLKIQSTIASILSAYDDLIENNNRRIRILEQMAENLYKEWFVRFRFPGHEQAEFENGIPKGWEYRTVEELSCVLRRGISPTYDTEGRYTVINQKCIRTSILNMDEAQAQSKQYKEELNLCDCDTVICSTGTGTLGRVGKVYGTYKNTTFDSHVTLVRTNHVVGKHYLYFALKTIQPWFMSMGIGSTNQQELYRSTIKSAKVLISSNSKLNDRFERIAHQIHGEITLLRDKNANLTKQRDMLLPRLMSGKLEV